MSSPRILGILATPLSAEKKVSIPTKISNKKKAVSMPKSIEILVDFLRGTKWPKIRFKFKKSMPQFRVVGELEEGRGWSPREDANQERSTIDAGSSK